MMRAGVLVAAALVAVAAFAEASSSKVQLVSQSATGPLTGASGASISLPFGIGKMNSTTSGVMSFNMDVATGSFRIDANTTSSDDPKNSQVETVLFSGKAKRMYVNTIDPSPRATQGCQFIELPSLSEPSKYVACVESLLQQDKKYFEDIYVVKDGVPKKDMGLFSIGGSAALAISINKDGSIPKVQLDGSLTVLAVPLFVFGGEWHPTSSSLGAPDASVFDVPEDWGKCKEQKIGGSDNLTKTEQAWVKCVMPLVVPFDGLVVV